MESTVKGRGQDRAWPRNRPTMYFRVEELPMIPTDPLPAAAIQLRSTGDVDDNLARAGRLVDEAAGLGARIVVLPEHFGRMGREGSVRLSGERIGEGPVSSFARDAALRNGIFLAAGSLPLIAGRDDRVTNSLLVWAPDGTLAARYDKMHLFDVTLAGDAAYRESRHVEPGAKIVTVDVDGWRLGLSICYDLRFPELYRALSASGAHALVLPAAFTVPTGRAHWELLLRARAVENQAWLIAAAQWGSHAPDRESWGRSMIVDPWGDVVARRDEGEGVVFATLDPGRLAEVRSAIPALANRRM